MIDQPTKVVIGSSPPEVWILSGDVYSLCPIDQEKPEFISFDSLEERVEIAFSKGISVVIILDPRVTFGSIH